MFWYFAGGIVAVTSFHSICSAKKRQQRLSKVSSKVRRRFERLEKFRAKQNEIERKAQELTRQIEFDTELSEEAKNAIEVAVAEGRSYTRVWVHSSSVDAVKRWAKRNRYIAKSVKVGRHGDVQLSLSNFGKNKKSKR